MPDQNQLHTSLCAPIARQPTSPFAHEPVLARMPQVMRVTSLHHTQRGNQIHHRATLHHRITNLSVDWETRHRDVRLQVGTLVSVRYALDARSEEGALRIHGLRPLVYPLANINVFETLHPSWCKDSALISRATDLWAQLPLPLAHLINAVLWDHQRLHRFVWGPSSLDGHHNNTSGNFRHSVEVAEAALAIASDRKGVSPALLIAGGLLHDVGKADEYMLDHRNKRFLLSTRGELVGHRDTLTEQLATARATAGVMIDESTWVCLLHMLNAARGAPRWLGLREPRTLEAEILSFADRLSGQQDLHYRCSTPPSSGNSGGEPYFGAFHPHLGLRPFFLSPGSMT